MKSELGINAAHDGQNHPHPDPELDQERRLEWTRSARKWPRKGAIAIRSERPPRADQVKKLEKDGEITEDDLKHAEKENPEQPRIHSRRSTLSWPQGERNPDKCDRQPLTVSQGQTSALRFAFRSAILGRLRGTFSDDPRLARPRTSPFHAVRGFESAGVANLFCSVNGDFALCDCQMLTSGATVLPSPPVSHIRPR